MELIEHYIRINQLRFDESDPIDIQFSKDGDFTNTIEPVLLIPFVENAFKHGIHIFKPSYIHVKLEVIGRTLFFQVENSLHEKQRDQSLEGLERSGIGIANVRKRLEITYPNQHSLTCKGKDDTYIVNLEINL